MVAKKPWNNCCSDVIKLPILSNTYNIEFTKNGRRADIFCIFYTTGYKTSLITVQKAHRDGFYINICNNILSVHENFPMIASMPSWLLFLFWIVVWKCALYFTWLKIRPPYFFFFPHNQNGAFWMCSYTSLQKSQHFVSNASSSHSSSCARRQTLKRFADWVTQKGHSLLWQSD